jgi:hypothetical protein
VAVEHNGEIVPRAVWAKTTLNAGDRLEVVHFVGGGTPPNPIKSVESLRRREFRLGLMFGELSKRLAGRAFCGTDLSSGASTTRLPFGPCE